MKNRVVTAIFLTTLSIFNLSGQDNKKVMDWANLTRYKEANIALLKDQPSSATIVLMGNSITEGWVRERPDFFKANTNLVGRGISGQTTPQMLLRFKQDVVHLKPKLVVLLCGINDIAQNIGPISQSEIMDNIISMCELAVANKIGVILSSLIAIYFLYLQIFVIHALCKYCMVVDVGSLIGLFIAVFWRTK
jgi:hypothetical protein